MVNAVIIVLGTLSGAWWVTCLRRLPPATSARSGPSVSVVVPARNEAMTLPVLLASLAALDPAPHEIIVVDDGSEDGTAAVARAAGATVCSVAGPPQGWLGKPWACHQGAARATGDLLLFLDADVQLAADALPRLVAARDRDGGILSVAPHHRPSRPYEQLSSWFSLVTTMASGAFGPFDLRRASVAFGPCLMVDRQQYVDAGGHAAVRNDVVEDLGLAQVFRSAGLPVRCRAGADVVGYRMYPGGVSQLIEGWTKNVSTGSLRAAPLPVLSAVLWVCAAVVVSIGGVRAIVGSNRSLWWAAAWALVSTTSWWALRRIGRFRWWTWAAFPVPLAFFVAVYVRSLWKARIRGQVQWRGRSISVRSGEP